MAMEMKEAKKPRTGELITSHLTLFLRHLPSAVRATEIFHRRLVELICGDLRPFSDVESVHLRALCAHLNPHVSFPSRVQSVLYYFTKVPPNCLKREFKNF